MTPLILMGASVRACSQSANRASMTPWSCDLFADRDHEAMRIEPSSYPDGFEAILTNAPADAPWMYTGALENHPELIDRMARIRPLWGIQGDALRACRKPSAVAHALASRGLPHAEVRDAIDDVPRDGSWLEKPKASAGGRRIRPLHEDTPASIRPVYYQRKIRGDSLAAIFCAGDRGASLFGVTRQLLGREGEAFSYRGSLGPWRISDRAREAIQAVGDAFAVSFAFRGIFGVDLILDDRDRPFPVEINPRYTASVEVLELALGRSLLAQHRLVFDPKAVGRRTPQPSPRSIVGKAILFADRPCRLPRIDSWRPRDAMPSVADIPAEGATFAEGEPVLTVLARGSTASSCAAMLDARLATWRSRLVDSPRSS